MWVLLLIYVPAKGKAFAVDSESGLKLKSTLTYAFCYAAFVLIGVDTGPTYTIVRLVN